MIVCVAEPKENLSLNALKSQPYEYTHKHIYSFANKIHHTYTCCGTSRLSGPRLHANKKLHAHTYIDKRMSAPADIMCMCVCVRWLFCCKFRLLPGATQENSHTPAFAHTFVFIVANFVAALSSLPCVPSNNNAE